jgi:hypothetical protein
MGGMVVVVVVGLAMTVGWSALVRFGGRRGE